MWNCTGRCWGENVHSDIIRICRDFLQNETLANTINMDTPDGSGGAPCDACREFMVQLMPNGKYKDIEIMMDYATGRIVRLGDITPEWWIK